MRYVRNAWYMAGWCKDFPAGKPTPATLLDEPLVFYRQTDGKLVALEDRCPHFGGGNAESNKAWAEAELRITPLPNGVRVERWMPGARTPPHQEAMVGPRCDVLTTFDYLVPGYFLLTSSNYREGAAARAGSSRPTEEPVFSSWTSQAVTPLTQRTTCYFFCFGPWSRQAGGEQMKQGYLELGYKVFNEDREMLTAQQKVIDADPSRRMVLFDVDRAPTMYRRLVDRLIAEEA